MDGGKAVSSFCFRGKEISCFGDGEFYKIQKIYFPVRQFALEYSRIFGLILRHGFHGRTEKRKDRQQGKNVPDFV